jgi:moderate conductance mechanosensitive channel
MEKASGTVEEIGLRVTQLRDDNGTVWYVRNGEVLRVGNYSQGGIGRPAPAPAAPDL